ncbi:MAG: hypothetical protein QGG40_16645, partial [Myxococcota bacterium]|nr:hypothetical protein [Myxococcota bacterium]
MRLALLGFFLVGTAHAEPRDDARRHFLAGLEAAADGRYREALVEFQAAQAAFPHPTTLYNIARSHVDLGELEPAISAYRLYQAAHPEDALEVEPIIAVLTARLAQEQGALPDQHSGSTHAPQAPVLQLAPTGATQAELARLAEIAQELAELQKSMAAAVVPVEGDGSGEPGPGEVVRAEPPEPDSSETSGAGLPSETGAVGSEAPDPVPVVIPPLSELPGLSDTGFRSEAYERVVITATRYGQDPLDSPSSVTILTADDIRMSGATNLPDLLRQVVGVDV